MLSSATSIGRDIDIAFWVITSVAAALFAIIIFFMLYFVYRYRHGKKPSASDIEGNSALEFSFLGISAAIVLAMFFLGWDGYRVIKGKAPEGSFEVKVTAQMWLWSFEYPDGRRTGELILPKGAPVKLRLFSNDVIHSLYVPAFRIKQDVVPGAEKQLWFTPEVAGTFDLFCAEYCGTRHSAMITKAIVVDEGDFAAWLAGKKEVGTASKRAKPLDEAARGRELFESNGCNACHSTDGSPGIGPTFKGLFGKKEKVVTNRVEREVVVDEAFIIRSEREPTADIVVGFQPVMPPSPLTDDEIKAIIEFMKTIR